MIARRMLAQLAMLFTLVVMGASPARAQMDSANTDAVRERGLEALAARRTGEAIALFSRCLKNSPRHSDCAYQLACAYSLQRDTVAAIAWLERSADWGFENVKHMLTDADLENVRGHAEFTRIAEDIQRRLPANRASRDVVPVRPDRGLELVTMLRTNLGSGAGIVIGHEANRIYIATANHVVRDGTTAAQTIEVQLRTQAPRWFTARLLPPIGNADLDLAVIAVEGALGPRQNFCALPLRLVGDVGQLRRGSDVYPVGYPGGSLWAMPLVADHVSQVSPSQIGFESQFIRVGFSGGALLNARGEVVGMVTADDPPFGRAVPIAQILQAVRAAGHPVQLAMPDERQRRALHEASKTGNVTSVRRELAACADVNALDDTGRTPLYEAAAQGSAEAIRLLLGAGARRNAWTLVRDARFEREWATPLHIAAERGHVEAVKALLGSDADVDLSTLVQYSDRETFQGKTALHVAAEHDRAPVVEALIAAGANVEELESDRFTPLGVAAAHGSVRAARVLVAHRAAVNPGERSGARSVARAAVDFGSAEMLKLLVEHGLDVNAAGEDLVYVAAEAGHADAVAFLLSRKARVNERGSNGETPLHVAAANGHGRVVKVLLAGGADPNSRNDFGVTPLARAAAQGDTTSIRALVDAKADIGNALHIALKSGNTPAARILVQARADLSLRDNDGLQPLHLAAAAGLADAVDLLIKAGASVSAVANPRNDATTALHFAAEKGHAAVVDLLIAAKAPVNARDKSGRTALYMAVDAHHAAVVSRLLRAGADPNVESDYSGSPATTAVTRAAFNGPVEILAMLLGAGGDPNHKESPALRAAANEGNATKVRLLLKTGARASAEAGESTALHAAAASTTTDSLPVVIALLVAAGAPLEARNHDELTPLQVAAAARNTVAVKALLAGGASARAADKCGRTPLWLALERKGYSEELLLEISRVLVNAGADVNVKNTCSGSVLLDMVERVGNLGVRQFLVSKGARS